MTIVPTLQKIEKEVEQINVSFFFLFTELSSVTFLRVVSCDSGKRVVVFAFVSDQLWWKRICMPKELARLFLGFRSEHGSPAPAGALDWAWR